MVRRVWYALAVVVLNASIAFSNPIPDASNSTTPTNSSERAAPTPPVKPGQAIFPKVKDYMAKTTDFEHDLTIALIRDLGINGCPVPDGYTNEDPVTACECEAHRANIEKIIGLKVLPNMEASAVDPGIMLSCALSKGKVEIHLAVRFKSKTCLTNCKKEDKKKEEKPLKDFPDQFETQINEAGLKWQITDIAKLDAGAFMNAIGACGVCATDPASCPAPCGCQQTYTPDQCPASAPPSCCNAAPEVQMSQVVAAPSVCAPQCPASCSPSCNAACCNGGMKRALTPGIPAKTR